MHPFLENMEENLKKMKELAKEKKAPVFYVKRGFKKDRFWILIFVVLSSRTKDEVTGEAVRRLIKKYKDAEGLAKADVKEVEKLIYGVGFYRVKAKRIVEIAKEITKKGFPKSFEELIKLKGVGRKTANVVLNILFKKDVIGVDTHVHRIANRLGLVKTKKPEETEKELMKIVPKKYRARLNEIFVGYGQTVCKPKKPLCEICVVKEYCDFYNKNNK